MNAVVTELSCASECIPQIVQYHYETNTMNLVWQQGGLILGGFTFGVMLNTQDGYNITIAPNDGGSFSSNISFMSDRNNGTTISCVDLTAGFDSTYHCSLIIGEL